MEGQSVLIVDDEPDMRMALSHALTRSGYHVDTASSGLEGLEKFKEDKHNLVITDMKMPEISGMEVLAGVKKICPMVPVIMITAYGTINKAVEAMKEGASDYILKPFSSGALEEALEKAWKSINSNGRSDKRDPETRPTEKKIITQDSELGRIVDLAESIAPSNATALILGESGTGKELLAFHIHQNSGRSGGAYVAVNCAALPENLAESELFGHEKGAFTGADIKKPGKFELANHGTILLDEISEMPMNLQAKLLRAIQEKEIDRVGGSRPIPIDARIIATSNIDLKEAVHKGSFREDLFYRLNVIPLTMPPLRERKGDIPLLTEYFLKRYSRANHKNMTKIAEETVTLLMKYDWKGNVRELENTIERAAILGQGDTLLPKHLFLEKPEQEDRGQIPFGVGLSVKEMERELIVQTIKEVKGNRTHAAKILGISIRTLRNRLREYREDPPESGFLAV